MNYLILFVVLRFFIYRNILIRKCVGTKFD